MWIILHVSNRREFDHPTHPPSGPIFIPGLLHVAKIHNECKSVVAWPLLPFWSMTAPVAAGDSESEGGSEIFFCNAIDLNREAWSSMLPGKHQNVNTSIYDFIAHKQYHMAY